MTEDLHDDRSAGVPAEAGAEAWSVAERALLDAALDFYAAAGGVIDLASEDGPQVRRDAEGFEAVRRAMGALEDRVRAAHAAGIAPERIAQLARIESEMVALILRRDDDGTADRPAADGAAASGPATAPGPDEG